MENSNNVLAFSSLKSFLKVSITCCNCSISFLASSRSDETTFKEFCAAMISALTELSTALLAMNFSNLLLQSLREIFQLFVLLFQSRMRDLRCPKFQLCFIQVLLRTFELFGYSLDLLLLLREIVLEFVTSCSYLVLTVSNSCSSCCTVLLLLSIEVRLVV